MRVRHALILAATLASANVNADEYYNGWTEATSKALFQGCLDNGTKEQIQLMYRRGLLNQKSTQQEIDNANAFISKALTSICTCKQKQIMSDHNIKDLDKAIKDIPYIMKVNANCSQEWQKTQK